MDNSNGVNNKYVVTIVIAVIVGAAGFFGGMRYGQAKAAGARPSGTQFFTQNGRGGQGGGRRFGNGNDFVSGAILAKDNNSITVQLMRGGPGMASSSPTGTRIIYLSGNTQITKAATGTPADLNVGTNVVVTGTDNPDGSMTGQNIQIRQLPPMMQQGQ